jgi:hypothetical protein
MIPPHPRTTAYLRVSTNDQDVEKNGRVANVEMTTPITFDLQGVISIYIHV